MSADAANQTIRLYLADDHVIVRQGLRSMLSADSGIQILGEAADGPELLALLENEVPDIVILDLSMPGMSGFDLIRDLGQLYPDLRIIVLTMHRESQFFRQATASKNVVGYLLKDDAFDRLLEAVRRVASGGRAFSPQVQDLMFTDYQNIQDGMQNLELLTRREREVLQLIVDGRMNKEIANDLFISIRTVESHRARIMEKLRCRNFAELMQFASRSGLV